MPISEFGTRALAARFEHWDRNHSGCIEWTDLAESARRVGEAFGRAADSSEQRAVTESCRQFWQTLVQHADVDFDGRISQDEYVAAFTNEVMADVGTFDRVYRRLLEDVVTLADASGDGKLNAEEYTRLMQSWYNAEESDAIAAFRHVDLDGDGFLTLDEMIRSATDFYLSEDPILPTAPAPRG
jgi:Ca2+-binding EF-hand superfamily protein